MLCRPAWSLTACLTVCLFIMYLPTCLTHTIPARGNRYVTMKAVDSSQTPTPLSRWRAALPRGPKDELDRRVLGVALPSIANLAVIPLVGAVDTFWVGRMGDALALAGQGAANQCFSSVFFLIAFIPTITAPLVAKAAGEGDTDSACERVCEALFLANVLGLIGTALLTVTPGVVLGLVLPSGVPAEVYARRYLRLRAISLVPALVSSVGFAAHRGFLDTITPLKVSIASNALNLVLDPILIFGGKMGVAGAALATAASETGAGALYLWLLLRKKLVRWRALARPPSVAALLPLVKGGTAMLLRQAALNVAFITATRSAQAMDTSGVAAAAYAITVQQYSLGLVVMLAIQATGATLVPSALSAASGGDANAESAAAADVRVLTARRIGDRLIAWSTLIAAFMAVLQVALLPVVTPLFSTLPEVRSAVRAPALVAAMVQFTNGPLFAGEGILMGVGGFGFLAGITSVGVAVMVAGLTLNGRVGGGLVGIWSSLLAFHIVQLTGVLFHHLRLGPLASSRPSESSSCIVLPAAAGSVPAAGEVCVTEAQAADAKSFSG